MVTLKEDAIIIFEV